MCTKVCTSVCIHMKGGARVLLLASHRVLCVHVNVCVPVCMWMTEPLKVNRGSEES